MSDIPQALFFCGVAGSGMSALAALLARRGHDVRGSDRGFDAGTADNQAAVLRKIGLILCPQDGSGVTPNVELVITSTAVESTIPDVAAAARLGIPVIRRSELLSRVFAGGPGVAVGGTSGKTTVTGMTGHILRETGHDPTVINGGIMVNSRPTDPLGNTWAGRQDLCVIEADESDGSIALYTPDVAAVTTLSLDHLPLPELRRLFRDFVGRARRGAVISADSSETAALTGSHSAVHTFGTRNTQADIFADHLAAIPGGSRFRVAGRDVRLQVPGEHNVANALCATGCCELLGVPQSQALAALETFAGIERRLQTVGTTAHGVTVIDDFAHNPEKIRASLHTLKANPQHLIVFYQPHGFKPTKMLWDGLVAVFAEELAAGDTLILPEIYYAGGTAARDISSRDLVAELCERGVQARFAEDRSDALEMMAHAAQPPATIVVMGARDPTLSSFARQVLAVLNRQQPTTRLFRH